MALLLCNGAFVSLHHPVPEPPVSGHSNHAAAPAHDAGELPAVGAGHVAALIFVMWTAFGFWLVGARRVREVRYHESP